MSLQGKEPRYTSDGMQFSVRPTDPEVNGGWRSEWSARFAPGFGTATDYRVRYKLPLAWKLDPQPCIIAQWHSTGKEASGIGMPPPLAFYIAGDQLGIVSCWDPERDSTVYPGPDGRTKTLYQSKIVRGAWERFDLRVKWAWDETGSIEIAMNGEIIVDTRGPNCYNDDKPPYQKRGIYVWKWGTDADYREVRHKL